MSKYITGEIAKLCSVTVRTVRHYDTRNILVPSELSEGSRRLYSEENLARQKNHLDAVHLRIKNRPTGRKITKIEVTLDISANHSDRRGLLL